MRELNQFIQHAGLSQFSVLDIGGTWDYWEQNLQYFSPGMLARIEIVNLPPFETREALINGIPFRSFEGDALRLRDVSGLQYDLVLSNSVIEHVGNLRDQKTMAESIMDLGRFWYIQTPSPWFPVEPHFYVPFFSKFPLSIRAFLHQRLNLGFMNKQPDWLYARIECENIRLLNYHEFQQLFPTSRIITEKIFGIPVSYIATNL